MENQPEKYKKKITICVKVNVIEEEKIKQYCITKIKETNEWYSKSDFIREAIKKKLEDETGD